MHVSVVSYVFCEVSLVFRAFPYPYLCLLWYTPDPYEDNTTGSAAVKRIANYRFSLVACTLIVRLKVNVLAKAVLERQTDLGSRLGSCSWRWKLDRSDVHGSLAAGGDRLHLRIHAPHHLKVCHVLGAAYEVLVEAV